jgi:mTERF domain-containing protein
MEDYLVNTCGLIRPQAIKAYTKLSHLKSPAHPRAVLTFLVGLGLGLSSANVAAVIVKDPKLLCPGVGSTLSPVFVGLTDIRLSRPEIARFVHLNPERIRFRSIVSKLRYLLPLFGSFDKLLLALKNNAYLL